MVRRLVLGTRANPVTGTIESGAWLSRPGVDVVTAHDDDLLISPSSSHVLYLASGMVRLRKAPTVPYTSSPIFFTELPFIPAILFQRSEGGYTYLPDLHNANWHGPDWHLAWVDGRRGIAYGKLTSSSFTASNYTNTTYYIRYIILAHAQQMGPGT